MSSHPSMPDPALPAPEFSQQWQETQRTLAALRAECDAYRRSLHQLARAEFARSGFPFTEAELRRWAEDDDATNCETLDQFLAALEGRHEGNVNP